MEGSALQQILSMVLHGVNLIMSGAALALAAPGLGEDGLELSAEEDFAWYSYFTLPDTISFVRFVGERDCGIIDNIL